MMPLLAVEAEKLSIEDRQRGVIEEIIDRDELFALVPFTRTEDKTYSYVREKTAAGGAWFSAYEDLEESASTTDPVSVELKRIAGQVDLDNFQIEVQSSLNDQLAIQLSQKAKGMGRDFRNALVNGDTAVNPKMFDGLKKLTPASQTMWTGVNGGAVAFAALDELKDAVKLGCDALMMRQGTWRAIRALNRAMGGNTADHIMIDNFGYPMKAYDGTPVIINDFLPVNEVRGSSVATTSIYALRLNEADGFHGVFGGDAAGFRMEKVGLLQGKDVTRYRMKWYVTAALKATHAIARLGGVTNI
jgi:HK97 family phage major capsid protein